MNIELNQAREGWGVEDLFGDFKSRPERFMFFLGAGFSRGIGLPSGRELAESLAKRYREEVQGLDDVIGSLLGKGVNREEICEAIKEEFNKKESIVKESSLLGLFLMVIGYVVKELDRRNSSGRVSIATTNWDETLTSFLGKKVEVIYPGKVPGTTGKRVTVYHLHGSIKDCGSMILTREEKKAVRGDAQHGSFKHLIDEFNVLMDELKADVNKHRVIFIGYSMADDDILSIYINSREKAAAVGEDYIIVKDEESKERIEGILAGKGLKEAAKVGVMDSLEFLEKLARDMGLVVDDRKVELETERSMRKMLDKKGSLIVVGPPLSGLTTLYNNHFKEFPPDKLSLDCTYDDGEKRALNGLMKRLLGGKHIALVGPEYTFNYYLNESGIGEKERKQIEEITVRHKVKEGEAKEYLEGLIEGSDYSDRFDEELKKKILELVKLGNDYPLKLLREVFHDVQVRTARGDKVEDIKRDLDEKKNRRGEVEGILGVGLLVPPVLRDSVGLASLLPVSPYLAVALLAGGGLYEFIKYLKGKGDRPFNKIIGPKKYWDSLNESERRMLCYKLDEKNGLKPGDSENYLKRVFGDELYDLERKIRELEDYLRRDLRGFQKRIEEFERKYGDELNKLPELRDQVKSLSDELRNLIEEHERLESKFESWSVDAPLFFIEDVEKGSLYSNFLVQVGVPKIKTSTPKGTTIEGLVESGRFHDVARDVLSKLKSEGRVALVGPRGVGKSTLATYAAWRTLLGGSDDIDTHVNALIRVGKLEPGAASRIENVLNGAAGKRFLLVYDPSSIEAYLEPETMQRGHSLKEIETTLKELKKLMGVQCAWVMVVLPSKLYELVERDSERDEELRRALEGVEGSRVDVDLRDEGFLRGIIEGYSGCQKVPDELVGIVKQGFSGGYTLVAKYTGVWLRERKCEAKDLSEALKVSEPKIFLAHYIWGVVLGKSKDLAMKVSVPLMLHGTYGPIPEGVTYITKAANVGGVWRLVDKDSLKKIQLTDLREEDLEPTAKWLSIEHEDLVEETLKELAGLRGEKEKYIKNGLNSLVEALGWGYGKVKSELKAFEELKREEVEDNLTFFIGERLNLALEPLSNNCWRRGALIIGHCLGGHPKLPTAKDLREDVAESLGSALEPSVIDDYLLAGNGVPPLIFDSSTHTPRPAFVNLVVKAFSSGEAASEVKRVMDVTKERGSINDVEGFYLVGLASIIASAVGSGIDVDDTGTALHATSFVIKKAYSVGNVFLILSLLTPLRDKVQDEYLELLAESSNIMELDKDTSRFIFKELNETLDKYKRDSVRPLMHAVVAYAELLYHHFKYFDVYFNAKLLYKDSKYFEDESTNDEEVKRIVLRIRDYLKKLDHTQLGTIAWAYTLRPALRHWKVKRFVESFVGKEFGSDVERKTDEVINRLRELREKTGELLHDNSFKDYLESRSITADEKATKRLILAVELGLKHASATYKIRNYKLAEAENLFNETANEYRGIDDFKNYIVDCDWAVHTSIIKGSLSGDELVNKYKQLLGETLERLEYNAPYLAAASSVLGGYLVSLALRGNVKKLRSGESMIGGDKKVRSIYEKIGEQLENYRYILDADREVSVLTRLMLRALLGQGSLTKQLDKQLEVSPKELIEAYGDRIYHEYLPALMTAISKEDGESRCKETTKHQQDCLMSVLAVKGDKEAIKILREFLNEVFQKLLNRGHDVFKKWIQERRDSISGFDVYAEIDWDKLVDKVMDKLVNDFEELVNKLDGGSLTQLIAPRFSRARVALMLHALVNWRIDLAKAQALMGIAHYSYSFTLHISLFWRVNETCRETEALCLEREDFRDALGNLFFYQVVYS